MLKLSQALIYIAMIRIMTRRLTYILLMPLPYFHIVFSNIL